MTKTHIYGKRGEALTEQGWHRWVRVYVCVCVRMCVCVSEPSSENIWKLIPLIDHYEECA